MDALEVLHNRVSCGFLGDPGPSKEQLDGLLKAAVRAPDHRLLQPWKFLVIQGDALNRFGDLLVKAALAKNPDLSPEEQQRLAAKPLRAPCIIAVCCCEKPDPKVPRIEQVVSAGAAANNIVTAAYALGLGAYWRTGSNAFDANVKLGLGLAEQDEIVGFIYLGTPKVSLKETPETDPYEFTEFWQG